MTEHSSETFTPIGFTMGDPAGIGPEIIVRLLAKPQPWPCVVYGDPDWLQKTAKWLQLDCEIRTIDSPRELTQLSETSDHQSKPAVIPVLKTSQVSNEVTLGQISAQAGACAHACIEQAVKDALSGDIRAIVTAPLHKHAMALAGVPFPGHTEMLAAYSGHVPVAMMLANPSLRVVLVTIHESIRRVPDLITFDKELQTIEFAHQAGQQLGFKSPRVAVAGLNPHAGEDGQFGREEIEIIMPAIQKAQTLGINVSGPYPGDTIFARARQGEFDVVVAQYHDQGLIPVKYLGLDEGVNVTLGLPFVRTSVDHGTAFDIAAQGIASEASLYHALVMADQLSQHRLNG